MHVRVLALAALVTLAATPVATQSGGCVPDGKIQFICGIPSPEDLVPVPRSEWVVVSGYIRGGVSLVNTKTFAATQVFPVAKPVERFDKSTYSQCPGPVDPGEKEKLSAHGLAIRPGADRVHTVYLVHHGFRESIEVFELDTRPATPTFTWIGCVVAPETAAFNSVTPLTGGGFAATSPNRRVKPQPGADPTNTGEIWEWNPKTGFAIIPGSEGNGPNGIEASPDGRWLYVNHWPARKILKLSRGQTPIVKEILDVNFQPDNIRLQPDGSLLAAGHGGPDTPTVIKCLMKVCADAASVVARIDPKTWVAKEIIRYPANEKFFSSTVALQVGKEIWIGTITGDRIARYPIP
jgi:DNA-binding beta-propeller fold protein YncE